MLGINVVRPVSFNTTFGNDGRPYVRIRPTSNVTDTRFITLLYPTTSNAWNSRPTTSLLADTGQAAATRVTHANGSRDDIIIGYKVLSSTTVGPYRFNGGVAVVSRTASGSLAKLFVAGSTFLEDGSTSLVHGLAAGAEFEAVYTGTTVDVAGEFDGTVTLYAPDVTMLTVNGETQTFARSGDSIEFSNENASAHSQ
ncbi:MAG: hypothetical protein HC893_06485 [Chloroflexaceae bacterium]|nr:hypothetical protein [Chloroflexaceae bacterium]